MMPGGSAGMMQNAGMPHMGANGQSKFPSPLLVPPIAVPVASRLLRGCTSPWHHDAISRCLVSLVRGVWLQASRRNARPAGAVAATV
jgi:hypothetical protein